MKCFTFITLILIADSRAEVNVKYVNDIIKSPLDKRLYRGLVLPNQLRVFLISDPETDKSAAALSVGVGHLSDPDGLPGLAHFCEHMLFLGSEKYPNENEFMKFISEHGGENRNAFTHSDQTLYAFDVESKHFQGALDIFAQFFISPLMSEDTVNREVNAVNSEFQLNTANDNIRVFQLFKSLSNNSHPFSKFFIGSKMALAALPQKNGIDVRRELLDFHEKFYSANLMILVVLGKESLDDLQKITVPIFSEIKNKNVLRPEWPDHPFGQDQVQSKTYIVPVGNINKLHITFPIPDLRKYYKFKPLVYISRLLSDTKLGSLISTLKSKNLAERVSATNGTSPAGKGFDFFTISIMLTDEGIEKVNEIIILTFQYLNFLRESGAPKWVFEEYKKISEINFRFQDKQNPFDYVQQIAENLHSYECLLEEVLSGPYLIEEYRPDLIKMVLSDFLTPSNVHVTVIGRKFENITDKIESWFGTKYRFEKIPGEVIQEWQNCGINIGFKLPSPNEFLPTNFEVLFKEEKHYRYNHPLIIHENNFTRIWFKHDDKFLLPKANLKFNFFSPLTSFDPLNQLLTELLIQTIKLEMDDYAYPATLAGFSCHIAPTINGFILNIDGFTDKLDIFLEEVLKKVTDFSVVLTLYEKLLRYTYGKHLNVKNVESNLEFQNYLDHLLRQKSWTVDEYVQALAQMNAERALNFLLRFFSNLFVECLIHGNIDEETANSLIEIMDRRLFFRINQPLLPEELLGDRVVKLNDGEYFLYKALTEFNGSSYIGTYYQCGAASTENNVLVQVLNQIIEGPCFDVLRTEEQLSYGVQSVSWKFHGVQGLIILIQSDKNPYFVDSRVENFLVRVRKIMDDMSEEEFEQNKQALAAKISVKPINLAQLSEMFWNEIIDKEYKFDRAETEVAYLRTITKTDLTKFFDEHIKQDGPKRRKLSVHIISEVSASQEADSTFFNNSVAGPQEIKDVNLFKESHEFYSPPESCVDIADFKIINLKYLYDSCSETSSALLEFMCRMFLD